MIDHVSVGVGCLARSAAFYDAVLAPLGLARLVTRETMIGYGRRYPEFWLNHRPGMPHVSAETGMHICLRAGTKAAVGDFHAAALAHGGTDDGRPGPRKAAMTDYVAAFIRDPDGNRVEAACFPAAA